MNGTANTCGNCAQPVTAQFCAHCGQTTRIGRLNLRALCSQAMGTLLDSRRGLLPTLTGLSLRPGQLVSAYIGGQRKSYINPVAYFFVVATVQLIDLLLLEGQLRQALAQAFEQSQSAAGLTPSAAEIEAWVDHRMAVMTNLGIYTMLLFVCIPYAVLLRCLYWRRDFNLAELLVFSIFTTSHAMLITSILAPLTMPVGFNAYTVTVLTTFVLYSSFAAGQFFARWHAYLLAPVAFAMAYLLNAYILDVADRTARWLGW